MKIIKISAVIIGILFLIGIAYNIKSKMGIDVIKGRHMLFFKEKVH